MCRRARAVHPRACGERSNAVEFTKENVGSSPRLRGTAALPSAFSVLWRFIPAPAGNGRLHRRSGFRCTVHPRACGERPRMHTRLTASRGSSPRLRGTGLTRPDKRRRCTVHPRACGERVLNAKPYSYFSGSSPRLRGTGCCSILLRARGRFIPAPAGNGTESITRLINFVVHPRACGERSPLSRA